MRIKDWSSDVCSSDLDFQTKLKMEEELVRILQEEEKTVMLITHDIAEAVSVSDRVLVCSSRPGRIKAELSLPFSKGHTPEERSEEHTSELQSLMRISYAVFCLQTKKRRL